MMERFKERLEVTGDDDWKIVQDRVEKLQQAQRDARIGGFGGGFGGGVGARRGGGGGGDAASADAAAGGGRRANRGGGGPVATENPDAQALQKALDSKASTDELKAKLAKLRETQKDNEAKLQKAQDDLRKVLTVRQEATAVLMGLLK